MRVAVFSDIHGNYLALETVLAAIAADPLQVDQMVCLGDAIQGGAQPAQTVARLRELGCPVVMGNADAWLLSGVSSNPDELVSEQQRAVREWGLGQLSAADQTFIAAFQPTVEIPLPGGRRLLCFHGSPASFDEVILPETPEPEVARMLGGHNDAILTGGHTHLQQVRRLGAGLFFNPGSVGVCYDRHQPEDDFRLDHWAEYAILTVDEECTGLEFRRLPIDVDALIATVHAGGRPYADRFVAQYAPR